MMFTFRLKQVFIVLFLFGAVCGRASEAFSDTLSGAPDLSQEIGVEQQVQRYTVRGKIRQLPTTPSGEVFIRHEPIPAYRDRDGRVVGMHAMTMPFWLGEGVSLQGYEVNDTVEFVLESQWAPTPIDRIVSIRKLGDLTPIIGGSEALQY